MNARPSSPRPRPGPGPGPRGRAPALAAASVLAFLLATSGPGPELRGAEAAVAAGKCTKGCAASCGGKCGKGCCAGCAAVAPTPKDPLDFRVKDIDGRSVDLDRYRGKVVVIVNVASRCGLTKSQYKGLVALYEKYRARGLEILAFPANEFLTQEPGTAAEIKGFCASRGVKFPLFSKITVKGEKKHPLYRFLTEKKTNGRFAGEIEWNFQKFLLDRSGRVVARFAPKESPMGEKVRTAIEKELARPAPATKKKNA